MKQSTLARRALPALLLAALLLCTAFPASAFLFRGREDDKQPAVTSFSKNGPVGRAMSFTTADFQVTGNEALRSIVVTALPDAQSGLLTLGNQPLAVGDTVDVSAIAGMRFQPLSTPTVSVTSFSFSPVFSDGSAGADAKVDLYVLSAENAAPIAENLDLCTYKNVALTQRFSATDPEGDMLTFQLVSKPARGTVTMPEDGSDQFVYTPYENKTGKDSFTYVAVDSVGNTSAPATVNLRIEKANTKVTYADMDGVSAHKAAIRLAENNIFIGECMGEQYFFQPDAPVTRSQFIAMAMTAAGITPMEDITVTGFADDLSIPTWAKTYASSALKAGVIQGSVTDQGQVVFQADAPITRAEAAVFLDRALNITDVSTSDTWYADADTVPTWAYQSAANLEQCGVLHTDSDGALSLETALTRADAAEMLCAALDVMDNRQSNGWFQW